MNQVIQTLSIIDPYDVDDFNIFYVDEISFIWE